MKKFFSVILVLTLVCAFVMVGCTGKDDTADKPAKGGSTEAPSANGEVKTIGNIATLIPEGWTVIPGGPGGTEDDNSLFLKENADAYEYIWVSVNTLANIESSVKYNSSAEVAPFTVNGHEWQGKENAVYATIGDAIFLIMTYGYTANDDVVRNVMASLAYAG